MNEQTWLKCSRPDEMLDYLRGRASDRKLRLFAVACCRMVWETIRAPVDRELIEAVEREARHWLPEVAFDRAGYRPPFPKIHPAQTPLTQKLVRGITGPDAWEAARATALCIPSFAADGESGGVPGSVCRLVREAFGNPFRPIAVDPGWLTDDVIALAVGIHEVGAFGLMPALADALQDAGCDSEDILNHCRDPRASHARGCWVVDLVLGKA